GIKAARFSRIKPCRHQSNPRAATTLTNRLCEVNLTCVAEASDSPIACEGVPVRGSEHPA
ncbi:MAG TPA: hypothetical protein VMU41_17315, partial [Candidatus Binataceae bacterium]|nr:hypothetical protein [Candidatus Binataceae bacterium]